MLRKCDIKAGDILKWINVCIVFEIWMMKIGSYSDSYWELYSAQNTRLLERVGVGPENHIPLYKKQMKKGKKKIVLDKKEVLI